MIGVNDVGESYFLPRLMRTLEGMAPGVTIRTVRTTSMDVKDEMERGRVDLAMGFLPALKAGFFQRRLFRQPYVCIFRHDHPLARSGVSIRQFRAAEHVAIVSEGTGHGVVDEVIERAGIRRRLRLTVPHFMAVGPVLQATDMIAVVPRRFADCACKPFGLATAPCPVKIPESVINVFWHARNHRDPANQWLRQVVVDEFADQAARLMSGPARGAGSCTTAGGHAGRLDKIINYLDINGDKSGISRGHTNKVATWIGPTTKV